MPDLLVDTDVFVDHLRGARKMRAGLDRILYSVVTRCELFAGREVEEEIGLGPNDAVAVLTHDVKFDEPAIVESLRRGARYVGAVGSKKTQADRRARVRNGSVGRRPCLNVELRRRR